jgi:hypothetical protein
VLPSRSIKILARAGMNPEWDAEDVIALYVIAFYVFMLSFPPLLVVCSLLTLSA